MYMLFIGWLCFLPISHTNTWKAKTNPNQKNHPNRHKVPSCARWHPHSQRARTGLRAVHAGKDMNNSPGRVLLHNHYRTLLAQHWDPYTAVVKQWMLWEMAVLGDKGRCFFVSLINLEPKITLKALWAPKSQELVKSTVLSESHFQDLKALWFSSGSLS